MNKLELSHINDNVFAAIGKEWMLVTAGNVGHFNTMTASWGCLGWLWNKPVAVIFVRPERFTHDFIESNDTLTLAFLGESPEATHAYAVCGSKPGRVTDKTAEAGLSPVATPEGSVTFEEARLTLQCRKLYKTTMRPEEMIDDDIAQWYGKKGGYHDVYVLEIANAYTR